MKNPKQGTAIIPSERIESKIYLIRGKKIMFDSDLAWLYGVPTKVLNQAVKRNKKRFPDDDFMFQLTKTEFENFKGLISQNATSNNTGLRSQIVTSKRGGARYTPYVFTEQGVAMLSSVLNSERAIQVNIQIIKTFTRLRRLIASNQEIRDKIEDMERRYDNQFTKHSQQIKEIFEAIRQLLTPPEEPPRRRIGFGVE